MKRIEVMGCPMDVATISETVDKIDQAVAKNQFTQHVVVNVAKLINMQTDQALNSSVRNCDIINIDGMGVVLGARFLGYTIHERVAGIDLFYSLVSMSSKKDYPIYLLGSKDEVVKNTAAKLKILYPKLKIAGYHHGYFWENEKAIVEKIQASGAKLLFVAITSPKKENFINRWKEKLGVSFVMGVGGTFDIVGGKVKRAPKWMQNYGLEWLFRIIQEPKRMWKRYLVTNTKFLWLLLRYKLKKNN
mgnify:CR=1 FL=1